MTLIISQEAAAQTEEKTLIDSQQIHKDFESLDRDGDGYLTAHDLRLSIPGIDENDITSFFDKFDGDRDGVLTFEEYLSIVTEASNDNNNQNKNDLNKENKKNPEY